MSITNLIIKPITAFLVWRIYQDRGGRFGELNFPGLPSFGRFTCWSCAYSTLFTFYKFNNIGNCAHHKVHDKKHFYIFMSVCVSVLVYENNFNVIMSPTLSWATYKESYCLASVCLYLRLSSSHTFCSNTVLSKHIYRQYRQYICSSNTLVNLYMDVIYFTVHKMSEINDWFLYGYFR